MVSCMTTPSPTKPARASSSSDSSAESESPANKRPKVGGDLGTLAGGLWVVSRILRRVFREKRLLCGRPLTSAYAPAPGAEDLLNPVCKSCHKHLADAQE